VHNICSKKLLSKYLETFLIRKMEPSVAIKLRLEDEEESHNLSCVPVSLQELIENIYRTTGALNFKIKFGDQLIKSTEDLFTAYLENKTDQLEFVIDEDLQSTGPTSSSVSGMFQYMKSSSREAVPKINVSNGIINKEDLIQLINSMTEEAKVRLVGSNREYMAKRQEVYERDEAKWREIAFEQLQFQERLLLTITGEVCQRYGINPGIFQDSCRTHAQDPSVSGALEEMAVKTLQAGVQLPADLTKEKLKEVLQYIGDYLRSYLRDHPIADPSDFILLKIREGDEVMKKFGYDENVISTALQEYKVDSDDFFAQVRDNLNNVMRDALGIDPRMMGGPPMPGM